MKLFVGDLEAVVGKAFWESDCGEGMCAAIVDMVSAEAHRSIKQSLRVAAKTLRAMCSYREAGSTNPGHMANCPDPTETVTAILPCEGLRITKAQAAPYQPPRRKR